MKTLPDPQAYTPFSLNQAGAAECVAKVGSALQHEDAGEVLLGCLREALEAGNDAPIARILAEAMVATAAQVAAVATLYPPKLTRIVNQGGHGGRATG